MRLVKGSHIVTHKFWEGDQAYLLQNADARVIFVSPYESDFCLIGTTDIPFEGKADEVEIASNEVDYLIAAVNRYFERELKPADVLSSYSGVRPLYDDKATNPSAITRDYVFDIDAPDAAAAMLTVFGGKITTYRKLAEHALDKLAPFFPNMGAAWTQNAVLPGGDMPGSDVARLVAELARRYPWLPARVAADYGRRYGTRADDLLRGALSLADLGRHFGAAFYEREARFLMTQEWATTADDILTRRTKHVLHLSQPERAGFETWLAGVRA